MTKDTSDIVRDLLVHVPVLAEPGLPFLALMWRAAKSHRAATADYAARASVFANECARVATLRILAAMIRSGENGDSSRHQGGASGC